MDMEALARLQEEHGHCSKCGSATVLARQSEGKLLEVDYAQP